MGFYAFIRVGSGKTSYKMGQDQRPPELHLIRGLPGTGKSTLAQDYPTDWVHLEADMFFVDEGGVYRFDSTKLQEAHSWCLTEAIKALATGKDVVVANTFCQVWEMRSYLDAAKLFGAKVLVICMTKEHGSVHGVPSFAIEKMRERWEKFPGEVIFP